MACPKCGNTTAAIFYTLRVMDRRVYYPNGDDETGELKTVSSRPKTGTCQNCGKRIPLPDPAVKQFVILSAR